MELRNPFIILGADAVLGGGRQHQGEANAQAYSGPSGVEDPEHAWKLQAREPGDPRHARRKGAGRLEKAMSPTSNMQCT
jgi:hypothetical protein